MGLIFSRTSTGLLWVSAPSASAGTLLLLFNLTPSPSLAPLGSAQFDTITRLTFGAEVQAQTTKEGAAMSKSFDQWLDAGGLLSTIKLMLGEWAWILVPQVLKQQKEAHELFYGLVAKEAERIKRGEARVSIMDETYKQGEAEGFDEKHIQGALMSVLFAVGCLGR